MTERPADRLSWTIARHAQRIAGGTLFAASGCASVGVALAHEMFGATLYQTGRGGAYALHGILALHARHWLTNKRPLAHADLPGVFDTLSEPHALLATPAQVDGAANANLSVVGEHARPKVAFGGTRGLADARAVHFVLPVHSKRQLVERVDFVSTAAANCTTPPMLFTDLCVMGWDMGTKRWRLESLAPAVTVEDVRARTGFTFGVAADVAPLEAPPDAVVARLDALDPLGLRHLDFVTDRKAQLDAFAAIYEREAELVGRDKVPAHRRGGAR